VLNTEGKPPLILTYGRPDSSLTELIKLLKRPGFTGGHTIERTFGAKEKKTS